MQVYGVGNPLIDILIQVRDEDTTRLGLAKGTMHLIDLAERSRILTHLEGRPVEYRCGGACPNTIIALSSLGVDAGLGGKVGPDAEGDEYIRQLDSFGVHSDISRGHDATGSSIILITPDTERTMNTFLGANREFQRENLDLDSIRAAEFFYFTGYMWDTEEQKEAILTAIAACREAGVKVVFDAADPFAVNRNRSDFLKLLEEHVDIFFANREEAGILFACDTVAGCVESVSDLCETAVIKDGSRGSMVHDATHEYHIPVFPVHAVDSTGAGDMYAAGFLYGIINGFDLREAGLCGSWLASRMVTVKGAQFSPAEFAHIKRGFERGDWRS